VGKAAQNSAVSSSQINEKKPPAERKDRGAGFFACPPVCGVTFWRPKSDKDKPIENGLKYSERWIFAVLMKL
jgi:hypothetical protein